MWTLHNAMQIECFILLYIIYNIPLTLARLRHRPHIKELYIADHRRLHERAERAPDDTGATLIHPWNDILLASACILAVLLHGSAILAAARYGWFSPLTQEMNDGCSRRAVRRRLLSIKTRHGLANHFIIVDDAKWTAILYMPLLHAVLDCERDIYYYG